MIQSMSTAGDFNQSLDFLAIEGLVKQAMGPDAAAAGPDHGHYPYVRQVRTGWHQDAAGKWAADGVAEQLWEVVCQQCGDTDGPAENQPPDVQRRRGPYRHKHSAARAANKHFKEFR